MKHKMLISVLMLAGLIFAYFWHFSIYGNILQKANINGVEFRTETVSSPEKRAMGLSGRKSLCSDCAMLFIFPQAGIYDFWMKDMNFDLDMIWIKGNQIIKIANNVSSNYHDLIAPDTDSDKVLEINAGLSDRYGFKVGDEVEIK